MKVSLGSMTIIHEMMSKNQIEHFFCVPEEKKKKKQTTGADSLGIIEITVCVINRKYDI